MSNLKETTRPTEIIFKRSKIIQNNTDKAIDSMRGNNYKNDKKELTARNILVVVNVETITKNYCVVLSSDIISAFDSDKLDRSNTKNKSKTYQK